MWTPSYQGLYDTFDPLHTDFVGDVSGQAQGQIAIVGLPGAGKKTLCNSLWGWQAVEDSSDTMRQFGLFTLMDLPTDTYESTGMLYRLESATLILFLLDGRHGLQPESFHWLTRLRNLDATLLIVLNRADVLPAEKMAEGVKSLEERLARPVILLSAQRKDLVQDRLLPAMLKACPELAVPLANEIPALRPQVARQVMMQHVMKGMMLQMENGVAADIHTITGLHLQMIRQIAGVYGYKGRQRLRERLGVALLLRAMLRYGIPMATRFKPLTPWLQSGAVAALSLLVIGQIAMLGYGSRLPGWFRRFTPQVGEHRDVTTEPRVP